MARRSSGFHAPSWSGADRSVRALATIGVAGGVALTGVLATRLAPFFLLAGALGLLFLVLASQAPRTLVIATLAVLPFVGLVRRVTGSYAAGFDPFTLIAPGVAFACVIASIRRGNRVYRTPLAVVVTAMIALGILEIFNPRQGGPVVGVAGAGLFVGPLVWFYVGHLIGDRATLGAVLKATRVVAVIVALYGAKQLLFGFTGFEDEWIAARSTGYAALNTGGETIRPFSTFASNAEYGLYLALGALLWAARRGGRGWITFVIIVGLVAGCAYSGTRSAVVVGAVAALLLWLAGRRSRTLAASLAVSVVVLVVASALLSLLPPVGEASATGRLWNRTISGLANPFDSEVSTLGLHISAIRAGIAGGLATPAGSGAALVNSAGKKLGTQTVSGDHDLPNVLLAYGWVGGLLLVVLLLHVYRAVERTVRERNRDLTAPVLFVLALFGLWFAGELYAVGALVWFFLGATDRALHVVGSGPASSTGESSTDTVAGVRPPLDSRRERRLPALPRR